MTDHLRSLGNSISIPIQRDEDGFTGRECPSPTCIGYFKVMIGTGLKGDNVPCHCPYCGHTAPHDDFWTKDQIEYANSMAMLEIMSAVCKDLKKLEFDHRPQGPFGIGMSMKFKPDYPIPIHRYREKRLETKIVCGKCTLEYEVYGVFAFCPDCGQHNSLQILDKNLELAIKMLNMVVGAEDDVAEHLTRNALEDCVSTFDGFGREICRIHAKKSIDPAKVEKISFQNLEGVKQNLSRHFNIDLAAGLVGNEWEVVVRAFQKRHVLSHKMGVVDEEYIRKSGDNRSIIGRKVTIDADEVKELARILSKLAQIISESFSRCL